MQWRRFLRFICKKIHKEQWFNRYVAWTFKPDYEYGRAIDCPAKFYKDIEKTEFIKKALAQSVPLWIPLKYRAKIEYRGRMPIDFGRGGGIAWYYNPFWIYVLLFL